MPMSLLDMVPDPMVYRLTTQQFRNLQRDINRCDIKHFARVTRNNSKIAHHYSCQR